MNFYPYGQGIRLSVVFTQDSDGAAADPTAVTLTLRTPDQVETPIVAEVIHDGVGLFHYDLAVDQEGLWTYQWLGTGVVLAATPEGGFEVGPSGP